jgi:NADPH:quinone reductase-like Zn-dependent oxidoreductase
MRVARIHAYGEASVIAHDEIPRPRPGPGEVLVRVAATSFNPSEIALRSGLLRAVLPYTMGWDVSGTVAAVGAGVDGLSPDDQVIGRLDGGGAAAEFVVAAADVLVRAPTAVPLTHAAAIPVAGLTAWQAVFEYAEIAPGQRVLVNGAGGGVGGFAVQLAKHAGAHVTATAGPHSAARVRRLGADRIVDYAAVSVDEPVDAVLHLAATSPEKPAHLTTLLRPGGVLVSITGPVRAPAGVHARTLHFVARQDVGQLAALVRLVDAGAVRVEVTASRPLAELASVHLDAEAGRNHGKTILIP